MNSRGLFYASLTAILWGVLAIALKMILHSVGPFTIIWLRFAISFIFLAGYLAFTKRQYFSIFKKPSLKLIMASVFLSINYIGFTLGVQYTSPSIAQVFIQLGPILLALSGIFIYKEKITRLQFLGLLVVVIGLFLFYYQQIGAAKNGEDFNKGVIVLILGGAAWAVYAVFQKDLVQEYPTNQLNLIIYGFPMLLFLPFSKVMTLPELGTMDWSLILFLGLNTLFAYTFLVWALKFTEANKVSVVISLNPIITFIIMYFLSTYKVKWIEPESFSPLSWLGAIMVLFGAAIAIFFAKKNKEVTKKNKTERVVK